MLAGLEGRWKTGFRVALPIIGALLAVAAFGALDHRPGGQAQPFLLAVSGLSAPWLLVPFAAGAFQRRRRGVRLIGLAAAVLAVLVYVVTTGDLVDVGPPVPSGTSAPPSTPRMYYVIGNAPWFLGAVIGGPVYGLLGYRWRVSRSWPLALAATAPVTFEPAARWLASRAAIQFWWAYPPAACAEALTGLGLTGAAIVIARRGSESRAGSDSGNSRRRGRSLAGAARRVAGVACAAGAVVAFLAPPVTAPIVNTMDTPNAVAITYDGATLYVADTNASVVTPVDTATLRAGRPIDVPMPFGQVLVTPADMTLLVSAGPQNQQSNADSWVESISLRTGTRRHIDVPGGVDRMALSHDGETLYVSTYDNTIVPVSVATRHAGHPIPLPTDGMPGASPDYLALAPNGRTLYVGLNSYAGDGTDSTDKIVGIDTVTGQAVPWSYRDRDVRDMAVAPDGRTVYLIGNSDYNDGGEMATGEHHLTAVSTATGDPVAKPLPLRDGPLALAVTPDGRDLAIVYESEIALMPLAAASGSPTGQSVSVTGWLDPGDNYSLAVSPDSSTLYVLNGDGTQVIRVK